MKYKQTFTTDAFQTKPIDLETPSFKDINLGIDKTMPSFVFKTNNSIKNKKIEYIEVSSKATVVPYTDEDGNKYEIPLADLIEYDDDNEIIYVK